MRLIGSVNSESDARRLGDFLLTAGMRNHVDEGRAGDWQIWVEHDDHLDQAVAQFRAYQANPNDPKYADAESAARRARQDDAAQAVRRRKNFKDVRTSFAGARPAATPVAIVLIGLCLLAATVTMLAPDETRLQAVQALAFQPPAALGAVVERIMRGEDLSIGKGRIATMFWSIGHGEVWRLVTPIFLHFGVLHLLFNLSWLASLGRAIEARRGSGFLLFLALTAAVLSNCAEALWAVFGIGDNGGFSMFGGFSGVNYALFGYAWIAGRLRPYEGLGLSEQVVGMMLGLLVLCMTGLLGPIANAAHVGGLAVGCAFAAWPNLTRKMRQR